MVVRSEWDHGSGPLDESGVTVFGWLFIMGHGNYRTGRQTTALHSTTVIPRHDTTLAAPGNEHH